MHNNHFAEHRMSAAWIGPSMVLALFLATLLGLSLVSTASRHILDGHIIRTVHSPAEAYDLWRDLGLRGRVILYFDRHFTVDRAFVESLHIRFGGMRDELPPVTAGNFLLQALYSGMFRAVYHVVPDDAWPSVKEKLSQYPFIAFNGSCFRLTVEGTPIIVTTLGRLHRPAEKAVIYLNGEYRHEYDGSMLKALLEAPEASDVVVVSEPPG
ncbi:MAG: hypothetical protein OHK006_06330 [Thermodesulfovibrionales bacterium]